MITSKQNSRLKRVRRLLTERRFRERQQAYVIESTRWLQELVRADVQPEFILHTDAWAAEPLHLALLARIEAPAMAIDPTLLQEVSETATSAGMLAVVPRTARPLPAQVDLLLLLDRIADPGNLGTILRTAAAAGVDGVILGPGCVDAYNPKVVRSSMGAHLRLAIHSQSWHQMSATTRSLAVYLASADGERRYDRVDWRQPSAIIVGSEAHGAGADAIRLASATLHIPMAADTESLNAAMSAGIILFEAARQRRVEAESEVARRLG